MWPKANTKKQQQNVFRDLWGNHVVRGLNLGPSACLGPRFSVPTTKQTPWVYILYISHEIISKNYITPQKTTSKFHKLKDMGTENYKILMKYIEDTKKR